MGPSFIAAFSKYPIETRLDYVRNYTHQSPSTESTPHHAGVRTPIVNLHLCSDIDDTLDAI